MIAIREYIDVKQKEINYKLPDNFKYDKVEIIILPIDENKKEFELWSNEDLNLISKVDFSTPIKDNEDYSKW